ncbi:MAG: class I SAM-dependent methyltransferase [Ginsengibacter sp.]
MIVYNSCPVCGNQNIYKVLSAKDYTVSGEVFEIWECGDCSLRFTQNIPGAGDIGKYYQSEDYISHSDTKKGFTNSLYHSVRKRTLQQKRKLVESYTHKSAGSILDIGAGTGAFLNAMKIAGWNCTGIEPEESARNKAKELYELDLKNAEALFTLSSQSFNAITMWHVLEHVHQLQEYIKQLKHLLKEDGKLFIAVPNYTSEDAKIYGQYWAAYDVPRHLYHFSPKAMEKLLSEHGLQLETLKPMWFDSVYVSLLSEKYKTGKSNILKACMNGMQSNLKALRDKSKCSSVIYIASAK